MSVRTGNWLVAVTCVALCCGPGDARAEAPGDATRRAEGAAAPDEADGGTEDSIRLAKVAAPSVVRLSIGGSGDDERGHGTGWLLTRDGVVCTNHHVIDGVRRGMVAVFGDGATRRVLGVLADDAKNDLALIRIEGGGYQPLPLADVDDVKTGMRVFLLGSTLGYDQTAGVGIVSAVRADGLPPKIRERLAHQLERVATEGPIVQHTATSGPGASGSPILDVRGRVVAVHHSGIDGSGMGFGARVDAVAQLVARTDLTATPVPFGSNTWRNLAISAGVLGTLGAVVAVTTRRPKRRSREA